MPRFRGGVALSLGGALLASAWLLATPPLAGPDEAAHLATAAANVRGQLAKPVLRPEAYQRVELPRTYATAVPASLCLALTDGPANCAMAPSYCRLMGPGARRCGLPMDAGAGVEAGRTYTGRYPPAYSLLVGWPTLLSNAPATLYAVRLLGLLLAAGLVGSAVAMALRRRRPMLAAATAVVATPMAITTVVAVNPNGLELAGALAMATAGWIALGGEELDRPALHLAGLGALALTVSRPLGPLEVLAGAVVLALAARGGRTLLRERALRGWLVVLGVAWVATMAWIVAFKAFTVLRAPVPPSQRNGLLRYAIEGITGWPRWASQAFGDLGYTNVHPPRLAVLAWVAVLVVVVALALRAWRWVGTGMRLAVLASLAWAVLTPSAMAIADGRPPVLFYFGRYGLVAIAFSVVACLGVAEGGVRVPRPLAVTMGILLGVANLATMVNALHHWTVGAEGPRSLTARVPGWWQPPLGSYGVLVLAATGLCTMALGAAHLSTARSGVRPKDGGVAQRSGA